MLESGALGGRSHNASERYVTPAVRFARNNNATSRLRCLRLRTSTTFPACLTSNDPSNLNSMTGSPVHRFSPLPARPASHNPAESRRSAESAGGGPGSSTGPQFLRRGLDSGVSTENVNGEPAVLLLPGNPGTSAQPRASVGPNRHVELCGVETGRNTVGMCRLAR